MNLGLQSNDFIKIQNNLLAFNSKCVIEHDHMLKELYIKNMAVIGELRLNFEDGFHIFTGETGAGKSILVEAMGLILGQKVKSGLVREGESVAFVEAVFDLQKNPRIQSLIADLHLSNLDSASELIVKRQIQDSGQNKVFINHQRATLQQLQMITSELIDFTGQHDQLQLLKTHHDREILDAFLPNKDILGEYQNHYAKALSIHKNLCEKEKRHLEKDERLQWIDFQLKELEGLPVHTEEELEELYKIREHAKHAETIKNFKELVESSLKEAESHISQIRTAMHKQAVLENLFHHCEGPLLDLKSKIEDLSYSVEQSAHKMGESSHLKIHFSDIESALFKVDKLKRKFGSSLSALFDKQKELNAEKIELEALDVDIGHLKRKLALEMDTLKQWAINLCELRKKTAQRVSQNVAQSLKSLEMQKAQFEIRVELHDDLHVFENYQQNGADTVSFWLSPNPGLGFKPLAQTASGGEASRLFLAIKHVLSESKACETYIFDEIDTGISGATVELTGKKLKGLAKSAQVFCVTHHAQIASLADRHYFVTKEIKKGQTFTQVQILNHEGRVKEVARLMGGVKITEKNLAFARELIKTAS